MDKRHLFIVLIVLCVFVIGGIMWYISLFRDEVSDDYTITVFGTDHTVVVERPTKEKTSYPPIIYYHGGVHRLFDVAALHRIGKVFAKKGYVFIAPERSPWIPSRSIFALQEARAIREKVFEYVAQDMHIDHNSITVVGYEFGSWIALEKDTDMHGVKQVCLLGFGAPYNMLYDYVENLVHTLDYDTIEADLLLAVSENDIRVDIETGEELRKRVEEAGKHIACVQIKSDKENGRNDKKQYISFLIKYLDGHKLDTVDSIVLNPLLKKKWKSIRETGYW